MATDIIKVVKTTTDNQAPIRRLQEAATQTFKRGAILALDGSGNVIVWGGSTRSGLVGSPIGVAFETGASIVTPGTAVTASFGEVPYMSSGKNIARGTPPNDARTGIFLARPETIFKGQINPTGQSLLLTDVGTQYGLTVDSDGHWYVDKTKTNTSTETVVVITQRDPLEDGLANASRRSCYFQFVQSNVQPII